jgi:hypothetical protein
MKADHLKDWNKLTKWLLLLALLLNLFASLGSNVYSQDRLNLNHKCELVLATDCSVNQAESVKQTSKLSRFCAATKIEQSSALIAYNKQIRHQTKVFYSTNSTCIRSSQSVQVKTIPASSDEPYSASFRG